MFFSSVWKNEHSLEERKFLFYLCNIFRFIESTRKQTNIKKQITVNKSTKRLSTSIQGLPLLEIGQVPWADREIFLSRFRFTEMCEVAVSVRICSVDAL